MKLAANSCEMAGSVSCVYLLPLVMVMHPKYPIILISNNLLLVMSKSSYVVTNHSWRLWCQFQVQTAQAQVWIAYKIKYGLCWSWRVDYVQPQMWIYWCKHVNGYSINQAIEFLWLFAFVLLQHCIRRQAGKQVFIVLYINLCSTRFTDAYHVSLLTRK